MSTMSDPARTASRTRIPLVAEEALDRARLSVVPRRAPRPPQLPFVVLVALLLVGGVAGLLAFNTSMQQASFTATALEQQAAALDAREQSLTMDLERLRDPQRVAGEAREIGMVPAPAPAFLMLGSGEVRGEPVAAAATDGVRIEDLPATKPAILDPEPRLKQAPVTDSRGGNGLDGAASLEVADPDGTKNLRAAEATVQERDE